MNQPSNHPHPRNFAPKSSSSGKALLWVVALVALIVAGIFFAQSRGLIRLGRAPVTPRPVVAATPPPATPEPVVMKPSTPRPEPPKPAGPTPEQLLQARIEVAQAVGAVRPQMARGDFAGAVRALEEWLATNGAHLQTAVVQGQAERLRASAGVVSAMLGKPSALIGQKIQAGSAVWTIMGIDGPRLKCAARAQYGMVERPVEVASLPPATLVPLLRAVDGAGQSALAAMYLLGLGYVAEARAAIPASAPQRDALLASIAEWEKLAGDHSVSFALDGVGTLVARGDFAAARQRLEQARKLFGSHDFFTTAYAAKVADWTARIASAPASTPRSAATPPPARTAAAPRAAPAPPTAAIDAARTALLEGVSVAPRLGQQGPVAIYGAAAFPLLTVPDEKNTQAVAAAGMSAKGRAVIFGHTGYIDSASQADGDLGRLMVNAVKWCGGKAKPRIGMSGGKLGPFLEQHGFRAEEISGPLKKSNLGDYDVVVLSLGRFNDDAEAEALRQYLDGGGGVIAAMTGWAFGQLNQGRQLYEANRANYALAGAGLGFTDNSIFGGGSNLTAQKEPAPMLNAHSVVAVYQKKFDAAPAPTLAERTARSMPAAPAGAEPASEDLMQGSRSLALALEAMPPAAKAPFLQSLGSVLTAGKPIAPTMEAPLTAGLDDAERARATAQAQIVKFLPADAVSAHPSAANFPGRVPAQARAVEKTVKINPAIPGWHSTALYADAGAKITVKLPADAVKDGYRVRIGCHTDGIYPREKWPRLPEISLQSPLNSAENVVASAFGGLVYIEAPGGKDAEKPFDVTIAGAVEAPYFVLGETTDAQWREIVKRPAPWAEFACRDIILSVPSDVARDVKNPTELMEYWQKAMELHDDLSGVAADRRRPERIVPDLAISAGFMHSGYPIMIHLPEARPMVTVTREAKPGWGFHHEIGHNQQKGEWTYEGTGEVTNNVFSLYLMEKLNGIEISKGHGATSQANQAKKRGRYGAMGRPFAEWKSDPFLALGTYIQLIEAFGWDAMKSYFRSYREGARPANDDEKRDQFMVRYSKVVGKNLGPFFDSWGIPVSASAREEIARLPAWTPPGLK